VGVFKKYKSENVSNELYGLDHFTYTSKSQFPYFFFFFNFYLFIYWGGAAHGSQGGGQGEGDKISRRLHTEQEPKAGWDLTTLRSRPEPKPRVSHLTNRATQAPHIFLISDLEH